MGGVNPTLALTVMNQLLDLQVSIRVVRLPAHKGIAFAKNRGAEELAHSAGKNL